MIFGDLLPMIKELIQNRKLIVDLAKNDFKAKYASSFLGTFWSLALPFTNILVFWYVFQVGLRNGDVGDLPFIVWYIPAFLSWTFFSEAFSGATGCIREYSYLIKKVNFPVDIIPVVKVISALIVHLFFILVIAIINCFYGIYPSVYYLQCFYYTFCLTILTLGLGWLFSALSTLIPDVANLVSVMLQLGFWVTPIFWNPDRMSEHMRNLLRINPMYYICQGYRDSFLYQKWFIYNMLDTVRFWIITVFIWLLGTYVYRKIKDSFADLL